MPAPSPRRSQRTSVARGAHTGVGANVATPALAVVAASGQGAVAVLRAATMLQAALGHAHPRHIRAGGSAPGEPPAAPQPCSEEEGDVRRLSGWAGLCVRRPAAIWQRTR